MTQPQIQGPPVPDDESLAYEIAAVALVTAEIAALVASVIAAALAAWEVAGGLADLGRALAAQLRGLRWTPTGPALERVAREARALGIRQALQLLPPNERPKSVDPAALPDLPDLDRKVREALDEAARLADTLPMRQKRDVLAVAGRASRGVSDAKAATRWTANEGINAGTADVARAAGLRLIWVAERNACLHCLAHAGWVVEPGDSFPPGLSFDPVRPDHAPGVPWPPLHPNCRCRVRTFSGPAGPPSRDRSRVDPAARLAGEARRSVVYQWTDYASERRRALAAQALLRAGADLPKTVEERARRALQRGGTVRRPK
ncbi:MAG TPA: hypothetical protein VFU47_12875 [Armatimonadota bacterium]|nr:hypothetical protein [Armatimonadota bacterium]